MRKILRSLANTLDGGLSLLSLSVRRERPALIGFMFHSLFADKTEVESGLVDPFQPVTVDDFRTFVRYFSGQGYRFVSPKQILDGLDPGGRYVFITFDDGYANNLRALPVAREFDAPITIFAATNYILENRGYWWDVHYRERRKRATSKADIRAERAMLKTMPYSEITDQLISWFGADALAPQGEVDRPMTVGELKEVASDPLVTIGNHTTDHAILTNYDDGEIASQINGCQADLERLIGSRPRIIAYPNGNCNAAVAKIARQCGLKLGVTTVSRKTTLPIGEHERMQLGRVSLDGGRDTLRQCRVIQANIHLIERLRRVRRNWSRAR